MKFQALLLAPLLAACAGAGPPDTLSVTDETALRDLSNGYVQAWLKNDQAGVMGVMAPEAVFIPHDGVPPHIGYQAIDTFWFPGGKAVGVVPAYRQTVTAVSGTANRATLYGRFDLTWQDDKQRYNWIGNFLINARKDRDRWLVTHMMASDEDPKITNLTADARGG
jgi:uncharacterized protein (TIGR02246 family)